MQPHRRVVNKALNDEGVLRGSDGSPRTGWNAGIDHHMLFADVRNRVGKIDAIEGQRRPNNLLKLGERRTVLSRRAGVSRSMSVLPLEECGR